MSQQDQPDTPMKWMIYGANGYTGELIARDAGAHRQDGDRAG
ncbi:hypothetical protein [Pseudomonas sp.]|jgi:short subunit dehydrogenase-like uncharacterized protein|nr:hypothetical protein [Pseudomonas sp.]HEX4550467.1 hypothetical protein [Pseudomonas sp.]